MCESVDITMFIHVSDCSKTQKMYKVVEKYSKMLKFVSDYFKAIDA